MIDEKDGQDLLGKRHGGDFQEDLEYQVINKHTNSFVNPNTFVNDKFTDTKDLMLYYDSESDNFESNKKSSGKKNGACVAGDNSDDESIFVSNKNGNSKNGFGDDINGLNFFLDRQENGYTNQIKQLCEINTDKTDKLLVEQKNSLIIIKNNIRSLKKDVLQQNNMINE